MAKFLASLAAVTTLALAGSVGVPAIGLATSATTVVLHFDELAFQPVNGLHYKGVKFGFTVSGQPSTDAHYHGSGPGQGKYVQDPSLEGTAQGVLTLTFDKATGLLKFGVVRSTAAAMTPGCNVAAYDASGHLIAVYHVNTKVYVRYSEGLFTYPGRAAVKKAVITFPNSASAVRFAIDNLTYST